MKGGLIIWIGLHWAAKVNASEWITSHSGKHNLLTTECEDKNCPHGGCYFENCALPVSCTGGACDFK